MWSVGCVFYELLNMSTEKMFGGKPLFNGSNCDEIKQQIFDTLGDPSNSQRDIDVINRLFDKDTAFKQCYDKLFNLQLGMDLLAQLLRYDAKGRINAMDALKHSFFVSDKYAVTGYIRKLQIEFQIYIPFSLIEIISGYYLYIDDQYEPLRHIYTKHKTQIDS